MIYLLDTDFINLDDENLYKDLPTSRIEKINRLVKEEDKKLSLGAGLLLNFSIKDYCEKKGIPCPKLPFDITKNEYGKPMVNCVWLCFNLSHSGKYVACVVS